MPMIEISPSTLVFDSRFYLLGKQKFLLLTTLHAQATQIPSKKRKVSIYRKIEEKDPN